MPSCSVQSYLNFSKSAIKSQLALASPEMLAVQSYLNFSKSAIKSQLFAIEFTFFMVQSYLNFSKSAIKSQQRQMAKKIRKSTKLSQFFKKRNQITTLPQFEFGVLSYKVISIFQKAQSNHNHDFTDSQRLLVQSYLNFSKSAIKSQPSS